MQPQRAKACVDDVEGVRVISSGKREGAGQHYYQIHLRATDPDVVAGRLERAFDGTDWRVRTYSEGGGPVELDPETNEGVMVNVRVKKNLYNDHQ